MRGKSSDLIGVLIPDIENSYYAETVAAAQAHLEERGLQTILAVTRDSPERQVACLEMLRDHSVDAAIVVPASESDTTLRAFAKQRPLVLVNRLVPSLEADTVVLDNELGARAATEHLLELGHVRIGFIGGDRSSSTGRERLAGYRQALTAARVAYDRTLVATGPFNRQWGVQAMGKLLEGEPPTAVVMSSNRLFLGAMGVIAEHGLKVPVDLSVVSFNDPEWLANWSPPITTVSTPAAEVGRLAARMIVDRLASGLQAPTSLARIGTKLIVRASTTAPPANHRSQIA
jgi:LacI family transcriptional regulator